MIYWYCYSTQQGYHKAEELKKKYEILAPVEVENTQVLYGSNLCLDTEEKLIDYLARLKSKRVDPISEKSQASGVYKAFISCEADYCRTVSA